MPLKIAAKVDRADQEYFEHVIEPLLDGAAASSSSARSTTRRSRRSSAARTALLFPIDWPEPFGLVMIEAMACGTPVIAFNRGSVPEVIDDGVTGFIVEDETGAVAAIRRVEDTIAPGRPRALREPLHRAPDGDGLSCDLPRTGRHAARAVAGYRLAFAGETPSAQHALPRVAGISSPSPSGRGPREAVPRTG